ncbi:MAG: ABC transporter permease, partial [Pseudomonadota bacterium]
MFQLTGAAIALAFFLPLLLGIVGSLIPAFGIMPSIAQGNGFIQLIDDPRFVPSIWLSLKTGIIATLIALLVTIATLVCAHGTRLWRWLIACLPPLLAVPHAALAVGLIFLIAPSGWLIRLVSPELTGWSRPPTAWVVPDGGGWSLILGLVIKETPFLLLTAAAQLSTLKVDAALRIGRTLGYAPARCWSRLILPRLYPRIRLTLLIVLAFNLSVVDVAILLGPGNPPTFSVFLLSLVNDPGSRSVASAGALLLAVGVALVFCVVFILEKTISYIAARRRENGQRGTAMQTLRRVGQSLTASIQIISIASLLMLLLWSFAHRWRFPNTLPTQWTLQHWTNRSL